MICVTFWLFLNDTSYKLVSLLRVKSYEFNGHKEQITYVKSEVKSEAYWYGWLHMKHGVVCTTTSHAPFLQGKHFSLWNPKRTTKRWLSMVNIKTFST